MRYAVVKIGGRQYRVAEGDILEVEKIGKWETCPERSRGKGTKIEIKDVLLLVEGDKTKIGKPFVKGAKVKAEILEQLKGEKIRVATYKAKSRYRRVKGFRPQLTKIKIESVKSSEKSA